jgi:surface antigen
MRARSFLIIGLTGALLAGCAADSGPKETSGAVIGGITGGLLGNSIGSGNGRAAATILGAALGAVVGAEIGRSLDERDQVLAERAAERSLRRNRMEAWENPETGHRGRFRPLRSYAGDDGMCRDFEHTIWVKGEPELVEGTACEMADGSWRVVG